MQPPKSEATMMTSNNVFKDLGFPPDETVVLQMRADLKEGQRKFIERKKLT